MAQDFSQYAPIAKASFLKPREPTLSARAPTLREKLADWLGLDTRESVQRLESLTGSSGDASSEGQLRDMINPLGVPFRVHRGGQKIAEGDPVGGAIDVAGEVPGVGKVLGLGKIGLGALAKAGLGKAMFFGPMAKKIGGHLQLDLFKKIKGEAGEKVLNHAKLMHEQGLPREDIYAQTGWFIGPDGKWKHEVSDVKSKLQVNPKRGATYTAAEVLKHPQLWENYPQLADLPVTFERLPPNVAGASRPEGLVIATGRPKEKVHSTMLHELQHNVQDVEGFGRGGNLLLTPEEYAARVQLETGLSVHTVMQTGLPLDTAVEHVAGMYGTDPVALKQLVQSTSKADLLQKFKETDPIEQYRRLAGETESRAAQARSKLTEKELRAQPPWQQGAFGYDVPESQQRVRFGQPEGSVQWSMEQAPPGKKKLGKIATAAAPAIIRPNSRGIINPIREAYPGVYKSPQELAAEVKVAPEDPALKELFGVRRGDLYDISQGGTRKGNVEPVLDFAANPKGSKASRQIMTPENATRQVEALDYARRHRPDLAEGMIPWYVMDPAYKVLEDQVGPEEAVRLYNRFNISTGMHSPGSEVLTEINRGTGANMMINRGEFDKYLQYGGMAEKDRGVDFPEAMRGVKSHAYHKTSQAGALDRYMRDNPGQWNPADLGQGSPKVSTYVLGSGVPQTGFQTRWPVPDAHYTRASGMSDVRTTANPGESMKMPEYQDYGPWYRENVAEPLNIEAVPAQGLEWGLYGPQTGVTTPVGAPKLELLAQRIKQVAAEKGIDAKKLRDAVLKGEAHAMWLVGLGGAGLAASQAIPPGGPSPEGGQF